MTAEFYFKFIVLHITYTHTLHNHKSLFSENTQFHSYFIILIMSNHQLLDEMTLQ